MNVSNGKSALLAAALGLAVAAAGCDKGDGGDTGRSDNAEGKFAFGETPLSFSFYGSYDWYTMQPWGGDMATKWIKDNKKVNVTAIPSGGAAAQKLNTMIAADELPDVIFTERGPDVERLRKAGKLVALDPYLEKYPNLKKWASSAAIGLLRSEDGKLYQFPNWYTKLPTGNGGYIVNKKIYKELGSPKLETFDDLYAYLKKVKESYPNVVPFEVTIAGQGIDVLYSGFAADHPTQFLSQLAVPQGGQLTSLFVDPVYKETMQFASRLYREKLMTQDALTQTLDQVREKVTAGRVAVAAAFNVTDLGKRGTVALMAKDAEAGYSIIWPLRKEAVDKNKVWATGYDVLGWNVNVITTRAKNPEGIFAYLDWLTGEEGQRLINFGPEGTYWQGVDELGTPKLKKEYFDHSEEVARLLGVWDTFTWAGNSSFLSGINDRVMQQYPPGKEDWGAAAQSAVTRKTSYNVTEFINLDPAPDSEEGIIAQRVQDIYAEARAKMLYAKSDDEVSVLLDKANKDANQAGYAKLLKYKTDKWRENLKKMGAK
ncbi:extracellular solute-binding protein [Paenibacillus hemerocallicola]|uniref:Extracellular solute-binding protein n=1 Tax=Paenibacillus hemerocallicola TaxID=1172614 RepID=A0A5C4T2H5_9BACL|nr:extracellular solute-binding protein [Paenibacillus hemerocallicola]TNJ63254.1 extracellular solute-binding protein [Paenibacillus hemerocallicola]